VLKYEEPAANRYMKILRTFLKYWLDVKMTDRSKKEENSLRKWLLENDTHFDVIVPDQTNE